MTKKIEVFASEALPGELEDFPDIKRGWGTTKESTGGIPPMKWFNSIQKRTDEWLLYLTQRGIPEWDSEIGYSVGALTQAAGVIYRAKEAVKGESPSASAKWEKLLADKVGTSDFIGMSQNAVKKELDKKVSAADLTQTITKDKLKAPSNFAVSSEINKKVDTKAYHLSDSGLNLNALIGGNHYVQGKRGDASLALNYPVNKSGTLLTWGEARVDGWKGQLYNTESSTFIRSGLWSSTAEVTLWQAWTELYSTGNTSIDPNGVLTTKQDTVTLTTKDLAKETGNSHSKVMTQKAVSDALTASMTYPVGAPIPWPQATAPAGFLVCNGQSFNKTTYPLLALAYPSGVLPDLRGEFIRGWDDGRGVDQGRSLLSNQSDAFASHNHYIRTTSSSTSPTEAGDPVRGQFGGTMNSAGGVGSDKSIGMSGGSETRPRNIAFNYIVRAA